MSFNRQVLDIDASVETERIVTALRETVTRVMRRRGGVVGVSGGVDSAVVLALCVRAFGFGRVAVLMLPEKDSDPQSEALARQVSEAFGVEPLLEDMTPALEGFGCYARRDEAIRRVFPQYDAAAGYKAKLVLPGNMLEEGTLNVFSLTIISPEGVETNWRLSLADYLQIVAASNFKQRSRMAMLYYHAELRNFAVVGTANKDEHQQGFFVKFGDGAADIRPIAHLYKTQVYQLAEYLGVPDEVRQRVPTTDTYPAQQTQQEFFFRLPFAKLDLLSYAHEHGIQPAEVSAALDLSEEQVRRVFDDLARKQQTTAYLRMQPVEIAEHAIIKNTT